MNTFYSQHGEDKILCNFFKNNISGIFIDVGAHDGKSLSNTLKLEQNGMLGICVEANQQLFEECKKNRKNSIHVQCACVSDDFAFPSIKFYIQHGGSFFSSTQPDVSFINSLFSDLKMQAQNFKEFSVPAMTLTSIIKQHNVTTIDLLTIDVEGTEIDVLNGMDFTKHPPRVVVAEANVPKRKIELDDFMINNIGYHYVGSLHVNAFYIRDEIDKLFFRGLLYPHLIKIRI